MLPSSKHMLGREAIGVSAHSAVSVGREVRSHGSDIVCRAVEALEESSRLGESMAIGELVDMGDPLGSRDIVSVYKQPEKVNHHIWQACLTFKLSDHPIHGLLARRRR